MMLNLAQSDVRFELRNFIQITFWILLCCAGGFVAAEDGTSDLDGLQFPLSENENPLLKVKMLGQDFKLLLDTTANRMLLDQKFEPMLGPVRKKFTGHTPKGIISINEFDMPAMMIGEGAGRPFRPGDRVECSDARFLIQQYRTENIGLLGVDFLKSRILRFNFDDLYFEFPGKSSLDWPQRERVRTSEKSTPTVLARLPDGYTSFTLVTGSSGFSIGLDHQTFHRLLRKNKIARVSTRTFEGLAGPILIRRGVLESLEFGSHRFFNLTVTETAVNSLQLYFLRRFNFELDWPNGEVRLRPSKWIDLTDRRNRSGFDIQYIKGKPVLNVYDGTNPSTDAGIQQGDRLLKINGLDAARLSITELHMLRTEPGGELQVTFEHDGVTRDVVLKRSNDADPFPAKSPHEMIETNTDVDP